MGPNDLPSEDDRDCGWRLGRLAGMECAVSTSWWAVLLGAGMLTSVLARVSLKISVGQSLVLGLAFALALVLTVLLHEFGHAIVGRRLGLEPAMLRLNWFGASVSFRERVPSARAKALSAAAGPLTNLAVALLATLLVVSPPFHAYRGYFLGLAILNLAYALLNLVPAYPQDGAQIIHSLLWRLVGDEAKGLRLTGWAGLGFGLGVVGCGAATALWLSLLSGLLVIGQGGFLIVTGARLTRGPS